MHSFQFAIAFGTSTVLVGLWKLIDEVLAWLSV